MANSYEMNEIMGLMSDEYEENVKAFQEACQASKAVKFVEAGSEVDLTGWQKLVLEHALKETKEPGEPEVITAMRSVKNILFELAQKIAELSVDLDCLSDEVESQGWNLDFTIQTYEAE